MTDIIKIQEEINTQIANKEVMSALVSTTFKGLEVGLIKRAIMEGMMRGFEFKDFLEKNVYAIPFKGGYSLVTSIDYARKIGMRSGVVGKSAPVYQEDANNKIISCTVTIKKSVNGVIGDFTAMVFFGEYNTGKNQWVSKPRTMIAKVAEMHALRMACPEELSQSYSEEEVEKEHEIVAVSVDTSSHRKTLEAVEDMDSLKKVWASLPIEAKNELKEVKEALKEKFTKPKIKDENA
jgi:hypothetical protein